MSIALLKHVTPTNVTRLHLALDTLEDVSPRPARERLQQAIAWRVLGAGSRGDRGSWTAG